MAANDYSLELYGYWRSSASWRVRIALNMHKLPYSQHPVNLVKGEQREEWYTEMNPGALVPSLKVVKSSKETVLTQSLAIIDWIEQVNGHLLLPTDPFQRAEVMAVAYMIACDIHPVQNLRVLQYAGSDRKHEWAKHFISIGFDALEKKLAKTRGLYCVGDLITLADVCLVPQVYNAVRFASINSRWGVDMSQYPAISSINAQLEKLKEFADAHPSQQPDRIE